MAKSHEIVEKNIGLMVVLVLIAISFGGLAEIVPLQFQKEVVEPVEGLEPWNALQLEGRDVYIREGCNVCHTQMVRPFRSEVVRYGHYSVAGEHVYEHPFLWGSKRTGPDLARVGGKYSDQWHIEHLMDPRSLVPESNMPSFPWLAENIIDASVTPKKLSALQAVGVPYTEEDIAKAAEMVEGKTEMQAVVAYLQGLGLVLKDK
jgi:cytochrome c oxidase cbb3-type subunit 2